MCGKYLVLSGIAALLGAATLAFPSGGSPIDASRLAGIRGGDCSTGCVDCTWIDDANPAASPPCNSCQPYDPEMTYGGKCTSQNTSVSLCTAKVNADYCTRCKNNYYQCGGNQLTFYDLQCTGTGVNVGACNNPRWVGSDVDTDCTPPCPHAS